MAQQSGEDSLSLDALLVLEHIAVHETIQHGGVGMNINVELQTNSLMEEKREKGSEREQRERDTERQKIKKTQQVSGEDGDIFLTVQQHTPVYPLRLREGLSLLCWGEAVTHGANTNPPDHHGLRICLPPEWSQPPTHNFNQTVLMKGTPTVQTWHKDTHTRSHVGVRFITYSIRIYQVNIDFTLSV